MTTPTGWPLVAVAEAEREQLRGLMAAVPLEHLWSATMDETGTEPVLRHFKWIATGARDEVSLSAADAAPGEVLVHSHVAGGLPIPSRADSEAAQRLAGHGIGFALIGLDAERALVLRRPVVRSRVVFAKQIGPLVGVITTRAAR